MVSVSWLGGSSFACVMSAIFGIWRDFFNPCNRVLFRVHFIAFWRCFPASAAAISAGTPFFDSPWKMLQNGGVRELWGRSAAAVSGKTRTRRTTEGHGRCTEAKTDGVMK
jgi:hypothetical protein